MKTKNEAAVKISELVDFDIIFTSNNPTSKILKKLGLHGKKPHFQMLIASNSLQFKTFKLLFQILNI